jgi:predicted PurR-regulated permease PerM
MSDNKPPAKRPKSTPVQPPIKAPIQAPSHEQASAHQPPQPAHQSSFERRRSTAVVELSLRSVANIIAMVLVTYATVWLLLRIRDILTWVLVSAFFAVVLTPLVNFLNRKLHIRRGIATALVVLATIGLLAVMSYAFITPVIDQTSKFVDGLPAQIKQAQQGKGTVGKLVKRYKVEDWAQRNQSRLRENVSKLGSNAVDVLKTVFSTIFAVVTVLVLTVLMLLQGPSLMQSGVGLLSPPRQERINRIGRDAARAITGYVAGNLVISVIAGLGTWIFLVIVDVPFAGVLALWVAFADLIPLVGATMGAIPTVGVAFLTSVPAGIATLIFYVLYQQLENHVLQPTIMSKAVSIRPLVVLVSVLTGVELFGILGALLAIPAAGIVKVIGTELMRDRRPDLAAHWDAKAAAKAEHDLTHPSILHRLGKAFGRQQPNVQSLD